LHIAQVSVSLWQVILSLHMQVTCVHPENFWSITDGKLLNTMASMTSCSKNLKSTNAPMNKWYEPISKYVHLKVSSDNYRGKWENVLPF